MKIIITESQLGKLVTEAKKLSDDEIKSRLDSAIEIAKNFKNPRQFALQHLGLFNFLKNRNLLHFAFPQRKEYKPDGYWTIEKIGEEAAKYDSRSELFTNNQLVYEKARKLGLLDVLYPEKKPYTRKYTDEYSDPEKIADEAKKYSSRTEFVRKRPSLYNKAREMKLLDKLFPERKLLPNQQPKDFWTVEKIGEIASKYGSRSEFFRNNQVAYRKAVELDILNKLFPQRKKRT